MSAMAEMAAQAEASADQPAEPAKAREPAPSAPPTPPTEVELHRALLKQIHAMYDNPELKRTCQEALKGHWKHAFYEKYKPEGLKKKI